MAEHDPNKPVSKDNPSVAQGPQHLTQFLHKLRDQTLGRSSSESESLPSDPVHEAGSEPTPTHIGRYKAMGEIARGGMGIIFKVEDAAMRRTLAMKVLQGEVFQEDGSIAADGTVRTSRFLEEAQVTGQLEHPGIIPVHEMGLDDRGRLFFTMRLVKGKTLGEVIDLHHRGDEHWTRTRALNVMLKVCEAMAFAHEKHVIHRDLKPANIMVGRFGETYVMDWGLAKIIGSEELGQPSGETRPVDATMLSLLSTSRQDASDESDGTESSHSTLEGDILGTPAYMPPEQARGHIEEMGPAADIYSVGAMLYHLLSGLPPYATGSGKVGAIQILQNLLRESPMALEEIAPGVPPELAAVCERAMERDPEKRYSTMMELADDLLAFMEQRVVTAYETGSWAEFRKWVARNRGMAISAAAAIVMAISGLSAVTYIQAKGRGVLAAKNLQLGQTNDTLAKTNAALDEATILALANEKRALEQGSVALLQSYRANVSAAALLLDYGSAVEARKRLDNCDEGQRGWEWNFLNKLSDSSLRSFRGHEEFVTYSTFSPDGRMLASVGGGPLRKDLSIRLWDTETGEELRRLTPHREAIFGVEFSPGGTEFVTSGSDGRTILFDVETGDELLETSTSGALAYHADGRRIGIGSPRVPSLTIWDIYEDKTKIIGLDTTGGVNAVHFVGDEDLAVVAMSRFETCLVDIVSGETVRIFNALRGRPLPAPRPELGNGVLGLDVDAQRRMLLSGSSDGSLIRWDLETGDILQTYEGHRGGVRSVIFHPQGPWIVSCDVLSPVRFWHENGTSLEELHGHANWTMQIRLSPSGDRICSSSIDGTIRMWDGAPGSNIRTFFGDGDRSMRHVEFAPDGERLVWTTSPTRVMVGNTSTGEPLLALPSFENRIQALCYDASGKRIFVGDDSGRITQWDGESGDLLGSSKALGTSTAIVFSPDRRRVAMASNESPAKITILDAETFETLHSWRMNQATVATNARVRVIVQLLFSKNGEELIAVTGLENVSRMNTASGELLLNFTHPNGFGLVHFDQARGEIVSGGSYASTTLRFHDAETGEVKRTSGGHAIMTCLSGYNRDNNRLAVGAADGTISLWHPEHGEMTTLSGAGNAGSGTAELNDVIGGATFSPNGMTIATLDWNGTCRLWDCTPLRQQEAARQTAGRRRMYLRDARILVDRLFEKHILTADVVEALTQAQLESDLQEAAVNVARMHGDDAERLNTDALTILLDGKRRPVDYVRALAAAEKAWRIRNAPAYRVTLGAAHFRMGDDARAAETLNSMVNVELDPLDAVTRDLFRALLHRVQDEPLKARRVFRSADTELRALHALRPDTAGLAERQLFNEEVRSITDAR